MTITDQRRYERVSVEMRVYWGWTEDCPFEDRIINLGVGGCFLRTDQTAPPGRPVFIRFWLPEQRTLGGEVRYHLERMGVGVEFKGLSAEDSARLAQLVEHYRSRQQL